jgi:hypothetical protein
MNAREIYQTWAPPESLWSPWAKPVLFAHLARSEKLPAVVIPIVRLDPAPGPTTGTAIVVDLPGLESISLGLDLARVGFRPVPLFNGCPAPDFLDRRADEVVPTEPLLNALIHATDQLLSVALPNEAPPAFLLDGDRLGTGQPVAPRMFDNRWVVFSTDFPSVAYLRGRGIINICIVHRGRLCDDLEDVLQQWAQVGISLSHIDRDQGDTAVRLTLTRQWLAPFNRIARRIWALVSLRRNPVGGYGGFVPEGGSSGG